MADVPTTRFLTAAIDRLRLEGALGFGRVQGATGGGDDALATARALEADARRAAGEALPLAVLARRLALRPLDEDALLAAYALEVDPAFATSVAGIAGEQFALPEAVAGLRETRNRPKDGEWIVVAASDPLNLVGIVTPGPRVPARSSRFWVTSDMR